MCTHDKAKLGAKLFHEMRVMAENDDPISRYIQLNVGDYRASISARIDPLIAELEFRGNILHITNLGIHPQGTGCGSKFFTDCKTLLKIDSRVDAIRISCTDPTRLGARLMKLGYHKLPSEYCDGTYYLTKVNPDQ